MCEAPITASQTNPKARIKHICCECERTIFKGETYHRTAGIWDGIGGKTEAMTFKTCVQCVERISQYWKAHPDVDHEDGPGFGGLKEEMDNCACEWCKEELEKL